MGLLDSLQRFFKAGTNGFNDFERLVLSKVVEALPFALQGRLQRRIEAVNLVQRLDGGREVNCFVMQQGKPVLPVETRIDATAGEKSLAKFVVEGSAGTANSGQIWLVDGNLFSLEFDQPTEHADANAVAGVRVELVEIAEFSA